ncbi:MAG: VOC family protein [Phycisphaerales bacterium]|nr:VOC family protein [Phycisphaerales bacterium]
MDQTGNGAPPVRQVFETVLYAADVPAAAAFYAGVLGLRPLRPVGAGAQSAVFRLGPECMLLLFDPAWSERTGRGAPHHGTRGQGHVALRIAEADYDAWRGWLVAKGVEIEREVTWEPGGRSIYFRDPAGNSVELAAGDVWGG